MTERPDTRDERLLDLYRRAPRPEPPARLDAAIRAAAHEAVGRRRRPWAWPALATAAVLVLAVGLVLRHPDLADRPEADRTWDSELRDAPKASPAMPAYRSEDYAPRVQESVPTAPAAAGAPPPRAKTGADRPELQMRQVPALDLDAAEGAAAGAPPPRARTGADRPELQMRQVPAPDLDAAKGVAREPRLEQQPAAPPAGAAPARRPAPAQAPAERAPAAAREATVATDPEASRADIAECPPLPPELASDPARLRQRAAELLEAGQTDEAHCLLRLLEPNALAVPPENAGPAAPAAPPAVREPAAR